MFTLAELTAVDRTVIQRTWQDADGNRRRFVTKLVSRHLPTGQRMRQFGFWKVSQCPLCLEDDESTEHVFWCTDPRAATSRSNAIQILDDKLHTVGTSTNIRQCLLILVRYTLEQTPIVVDLVSRTDLRTLLAQQLTLGTFSLIAGRLVHGWATSQDQAFKNYAPWRNGETWAAQVVSALWELAFSIWCARNAVLHDAQENPLDIDPDSVDFSIFEEWTMGAEPSWDQGGRSLFLGITCEALLAKPLHQRRQWLHYVQLARTSSIPSPFLATDGSEL
jgi:hypothetical protein